ncbi:UDP-N-acetylmuramoyl-tripeptide--D-alanyl-D-alanine ligase [Gallibacterium salpingitidis]|uniref:UDP-N-acetylmuramoyl-tripeptide--D-alanyl-D- alanine ligase n=1 Tax=Gallibacterium salpingitidis TaxID=505341 RepID=UPI000805DA8B|nr:UDP-N-acetylmuramoyl-tripeptide--D-alanyl-D-alanine ligase [Gallibacterium salpingitidis]OBX09017.1 UDP-N-acetylmuramoyl-tripeptide--D-alanyl-D-alanine ligase [Gallibacterium salpingitidis]
MITINFSTLSKLLAAQEINPPQADIEVDSVTTDSRTNCCGSIFFALRGESFDAHQFLERVYQQGAKILVVEQANPDIPLPQLVVADTKKALGQLAAWVRLQVNPKVAAMTGSSGKTTVKEMTAAILQHTANSPDEVLFTAGNFNNDIGVPLTLLRLTNAHRYAVIELGANHAGEIAYTTQLARPDVALVNNVAPAHLEGFGSVEGVAKAKGEIYQGLTSNGVAIVNANCQYLNFWQQNIGHHPIQQFSINSAQADVYAKAITSYAEGYHFVLCTPQGEIAIDLPYLGEHNISNALAAASLALVLGASLQDIKAGLAAGKRVKGRLFPVIVNPQFTILDDTYNANVDSLKAAIAVLQQATQAIKILAVGDMAELGESTEQCHQQVAEAAHQANLSKVFSFGHYSRAISARCGGEHYQQKAELITALQQYVTEQLQAGKTILLLVKGSRSMKMEEIVEAFKGFGQC